MHRRETVLYGERMQQLKPNRELNSPLKSIRYIFGNPWQLLNYCANCLVSKYLLSEMSVSWNFILLRHARLEAYNHVSNRVCQVRLCIRGLQRVIAEEGWECVLSCQHSWDGSGAFFFLAR